MTSRVSRSSLATVQAMTCGEVLIRNVCITQTRCATQRGACPEKKAGDNDNFRRQRYIANTHPIRQSPMGQPRRSGSIERSAKGRSVLWNPPSLGKPRLVFECSGQDRRAQMGTRMSSIPRANQSIPARCSGLWQCAPALCGAFYREACAIERSDADRNLACGKQDHRGAKTHIGKSESDPTRHPKVE